MAAQLYFAAVVTNFFFPSLIFSGCRLDVYYTSMHDVAMGRI